MIFTFKIGLVFTILFVISTNCVDNQHRARLLKLSCRLERSYGSDIITLRGGGSNFSKIVKRHWKEIGGAILCDIRHAQRVFEEVLPGLDSSVNKRTMGNDDDSQKDEMEFNVLVEQLITLVEKQNMEFDDGNFKNFNFETGVEIIKKMFETLRKLIIPFPIIMNQIQRLYNSTDWAVFNQNYKDVLELGGGKLNEVEKCKGRMMEKIVTPYFMKGDHSYDEYNCDTFYNDQ